MFYSIALNSIVNHQQQLLESKPCKQRVSDCKNAISFCSFASTLNIKEVELFNTQEETINNGSVAIIVCKHLINLNSNKKTTKKDLTFNYTDKELVKIGDKVYLIKSIFTNHSSIVQEVKTRKIDGVIVLVWKSTLKGVFISNNYNALKGDYVKVATILDKDNGFTKLLTI